MAEAAGSRTVDLAGIWKLGLGSRDSVQADQTILLPGTIDEQGASIAGVPSGRDGSIMRLSPAYRYEGYAVYERHFELNLQPGERVIFHMERTRASRVWVNGIYIGQDGIPNSSVFMFDAAKQAAALIYIIPLLVVYFLTQRHLVENLEMSGIVG